MFNVISQCILALFLSHITFSCSPTTQKRAVFFFFHHSGQNTSSRPATSFRFRYTKKEKGITQQRQGNIYSIF